MFTGIHVDIAESNCQSIRQFISESPWNKDTPMEQVARDVNELLGGHIRELDHESKAVMGGGGP